MEKTDWLAGRGSGILLHLTSLPSRYGIGDLGPAAREFVDFLVAAGQGFWQFLPLCPVSRGLDHSPYMGLSAFAGNPLLISPESLVADGLLPGRVLETAPSFSEYLVEYEQVAEHRAGLLAAAFQEFQAQGGPDAADFSSFCQQNPWLEDFGLFMGLREKHQGRSWPSWPRPLAAREERALAAARVELGERLSYHRFVQFCFHRQWQQLRDYARKQGVRLIGDLPFYVALDSADVWCHQACFKLDRRTLLPSRVAGVPPDYFSATGQRWGNPLFRWHARQPGVREELYAWWQRRFQQTFRTVDIVRVDHFRGFESCWEIPASEPDAVRGRWVKGPGRAFFAAMERKLGRLPIIAEDLGLITPAVEELRDHCGFPGMKVLQFAFDSDAMNSHLPHNYTTTNCVVYTGTHDNDTTVGWFLSGKVPRQSKDRALRYAHSQEGSPIHWDFVRMAFSSVAALAMVPLQDVLGFGSDCRMNTPSTPAGNWRWRCAPRFLTGEVAAWLRDESCFYGRCRPESGER